MPANSDLTTDSGPFTVVDQSGGQVGGRFPRFLILIVGVMGLAGCLVFPFPMQGRHWAALFDLAHAPAFFAVFLGIAGVLDPTTIGLRSCMSPIMVLSVRSLVVLSATLCGVGVAGELLQGLVSRTPSLNDVLANCSGLLAGMLWCVSRRLKQDRQRWILAMIAPALVFAVSLPALWELRECELQRREFPWLASFERAQELTAWFPHEATATVAADWASHGAKSMRIQGKTRWRFPGATMIWPVSDWTGYVQLRLEVYNPQDTNLSVGINIADFSHTETGYEPSDRFQKRYVVPPSSALTISIPLNEVASSPATREMVMTEIAMLDLYMPEADKPTTMFVDNIRLTK